MSTKEMRTIDEIENRIRQWRSQHRSEKEPIMYWSPEDYKILKEYVLELWQEGVNVSPWRIEKYMGITHEVK